MSTERTAACRPIGKALRSWLASKWPVWRFLLLFGGGLVLFYMGYAFFTESSYAHVLLRLLATISAWVLGILGYEASVNGAIVTGPSFAFRVVHGCDGLEPIGFLLAATFATPTKLVTRCCFALMGSLLLWTMNLVRLVSLAIIDVHVPRLTHTTHMEVWPALTIVIVVVLWVLWARRVGLPNRVVTYTG